MVILTYLSFPVRTPNRTLLAIDKLTTRYLKSEFRYLVRDILLLIITFRLKSA